MRAKLISREHGEFVFSEAATIGRSASNSVCIEASVVSTEHARITFDADTARYMLEDLGSLNGTKVDGMSVDRPEPLGALHLICFGGSENFIFQMLTAESESELDTIEIPAVDKTQVGEEVPVLPEPLRDAPDEAETPATSEGDGGTVIEKDVVALPEVLAPAAESEDAASEAPGEEAAGEEAAEAAADEAVAGGAEPHGVALVFELEGELRRFELPEGEFVVGRSKHAEIRLEVSDLSRRHAALTMSGGRLSIRDLGSRNHTYLNDDQVREKTPVPAGALLVFGRLKARVVGLEEAGGAEGAESEES